MVLTQLRCEGGCEVMANAFPYHYGSYATRTVRCIL